MKLEELTFERNGEHYKVIITYKHQRNVYFRYRDDAFLVSAPYRTPKKLIISGINKYYDKLIKQNSKSVHYSFEKDHIFLLGEEISISSLNIKNEEELRGFLKNIALKTLTEEVRKYEGIMGIEKPYKIRVKDTCRQYGSNSKRTHSLSFQISLIHYSLDIIDTVVVHELAHDFERNHQKAFYNVVYNFCPNYKELQRKLKRGIHK